MVTLPVWKMITKLEFLYKNTTFLSDFFTRKPLKINYHQTSVG